MEKYIVEITLSPSRMWMLTSQTGTEAWHRYLMNCFPLSSTLIPPFPVKNMDYHIEPSRAQRKVSPAQQHPNHLCAIHHILILNPNPSGKHKSMLLTGKKMDPIPLKSSTSANSSPSTPCPCSSHTWTPAPEGFCEGQDENSS